MDTKVLITGVNGLIGGEVYLSLADQSDRFDVYSLDRPALPSPNVSPDRHPSIDRDRFLEVDLADLALVTDACQDMDTVVHLGANSESNGPWDNLLESNITGTYNLFEACRRADVKRVVYASSVQVNFGYSLDEPYLSLIDGKLDDVPDPFPKLDHTDADPIAEHIRMHESLGRGIGPRLCRRARALRALHSIRMGDRGRRPLLSLGAGHLVQLSRCRADGNPMPIGSRIPEV